jgi:hypothetical protein
VTRPSPLGTAGRAKLFGEFKYEPAPVPGNPERIRVLGGWARNHLVTVQLPDELAALPGSDLAVMHKLVVWRFLELVDAWRNEGLLGDVLTWNGSYAARLVRGTTKGTLSAHAWGSAFDINAAWNGLGRKPAPYGTAGSVLRLVPFAEQMGWYWGGRMSRPDGMHFELARL